MERVSAWVGAGLLSAGVSAALLAGAGTAVADDATAGGSDSTPAAAGTDSGTANTTRPAIKSSSRPGAAHGREVRPDRTAQDPADLAPDRSSGPPARDEAGEVQDASSDTSVTDGPKRTTRSERIAPRTPDTDATTTDTQTGPRAEGTDPQTRPAVEVAGSGVRPPAVTDIGSRMRTEALVSTAPAASLLVAEPDAVAPVQATAAPIPSLIRWLQGITGRITNGIGSLIFNSLQALESLLTGPPVLPPNTTVTVRNSTILLSTGQRVNANWYYPEGDEVPEKLIVLQHGFFALGPMYSFTAANLAAATNSIVVTPTISSNPFAGEDGWINGAGMAAAIADLFVGERSALTESAIAAGFATRYGLDPATAVLPQKFGLAGHSAGAGLVSAAAGYLVDKGAADDLVGVITYDGVPTGSTMSVALAKLQAYQDATGRYIPVREIGAPPNAFNFISTINDALNTARPGRFNGVVLAGGVHMDSMRGGNSLIQFGAQLLAGVPQPQNPPAVVDLSVQWFNDWFAGDTDNGDDLLPGSTIAIPTPNGTAQGTVIGAALPAASRFVTIAV